MNTITREQLQNILLTGECVVEFTKINGEVRTMPCTLNEALIPQAPIIVSEQPAPKREKKFNPDVMSVWCLDKKEWRSFRIANVISAKEKCD